MRSRRHWLSRFLLLPLGVAGGLLPWRGALAAARRGVVHLKGDAVINGKRAAPGMRVAVGDRIVTESGAELTAVVGADAMLIRGGSTVELVPARAGSTYLLRVVTGAVLAVFAPGRPRQLATATAVIGIRGTGAYVAVERDRTYVCICYGTADLTPVDDPSAAETVTTRHHDEPRYIYRSGMPAMMEVAPVVNHSDEELVLLEGLVGRKPPFEPGKY